METLLENYKYFVNESHKLTDSKHLNKVLESFIKFWETEMGLTPKDARILITRVKKSSGGYIDLSKVSKNKKNIVLKINKEMSLKFIMMFIGHEYTHVKQISNNQLWYTKTHIQWLGKDYMSLKDYQKLTRSVDNNSSRFEEYKNLPWEIEAYDNGSTCVDRYKESKEYKELLELGDDTINYILESIW